MNLVKVMSGSGFPLEKHWMVKKSNPNSLSGQDHCTSEWRGVARKLTVGLSRNTVKFINQIKRARG